MRAGPKTFCSDGILYHPTELAECKMYLTTKEGNSSDYSLIRCSSCGQFWRSKAAYVILLPFSREQ